MASVTRRPIGAGSLRGKDADVLSSTESDDSLRLLLEAPTVSNPAHSKVLISVDFPSRCTGCQIIVYDAMVNPTGEPDARVSLALRFRTPCRWES